jgi:hypothetical protein
MWGISTQISNEKKTKQPNQVNKNIFVGYINKNNKLLKIHTFKSGEI